MKLLIETIALRKGIDQVRQLLHNVGTIPILSNILMDARDGNLSLSVTDGDIEITTIIPDVQILSEGGICVSGRLFSDAVKRLPNGSQIEITKEGRGDEVECRCGRIQFSAMTLPAADWPHIPAGEIEYVAIYPAQEMARALEMVSHSQSREEVRYYLNGVHMHPIAEDGRVAFVAASGPKLSLYKSPPPTYKIGTSFPAYIIPTRAASEIARMVSGMGEIDTVRLSGNEAKLVVEAGSIKMITKLVDGTFPDYNRVIPPDTETTITIDCGVLKNAMDRATVFSGTTGKGQMRTSGATLKFTKDELEVRAGLNGEGKANEVIPVDYDGPEIEVGMNALHLVEHLNVIKSRDVHLKFHSLEPKNNPMILLGDDPDVDYLAVLTLMKI